MLLSVVLLLCVHTWVVLGSDLYKHGHRGPERQRTPSVVSGPGQLSFNLGNPPRPDYADGYNTLRLPPYQDHRRPLGYRQYRNSYDPVNMNNMHSFSQPGHGQSYHAMESNPYAMYDMKQSKPYYYSRHDNNDNDDMYSMPHYSNDRHDSPGPLKHNNVPLGGYLNVRAFGPARHYGNNNNNGYRGSAVDDNDHDNMMLMQYPSTYHKTRHPKSANYAVKRDSRSSPEYHEEPFLGFPNRSGFASSGFNRGLPNDRYKGNFYVVNGSKRALDFSGSGGNANRNVFGRYRMFHGFSPVIYRYERDSSFSRSGFALLKCNKFHCPL